ncbi:hypothetical protein SAMD00023353_1600390 [Rosellinia necatrix]|uniref:Uncharacterized protein n=1 Tax=Rosellinia necatrix TaxID=77044 RepID=A0A1W2TIG6_ROSNE|nr:hypothetical protein SAMD00023353_1600390 [Rosellinia necatrix]
MADPYLTVLSRITATKECISQWIRDFEEIRPPHEVFEEEVHLPNDNIQKERQLILSGHSYEQISSALDRVVRYSGQLKGLQINYKATVDKQETTYRQSLQSHLGSLAGDIVNILGISLVEEVLHLVKEVPRPRPVSAQRTDSHSALPPDPDRVVRKAIAPPRDLRRRRKRTRPESYDAGEPSQRRLRSGSNRAEGKRPAGVAGRRRRKSVDAITEPIPGEVYLGYWPKSRSWLAVLLLPMGSFTDIGLHGTIADTGLLDDVPPCYRYNRRTREFGGWQDSFEDAGPSILKRQFPVMYFDDLEFPKRSSVGWMAAKDLKLFDPQDPSVRLIPNYRSVLDFLERRHSARGPEAQQEEAAAAEIDSTRP